MGDDSRVLVVGGISGIAIPGSGASAIVQLNWNHYLIESFMLFAQSGAPADAAALSVSMVDTKTSETLFSSDDGDQFMPALALVGGPTILSPIGPRWFRLRRLVTPEDTWNLQVKGTPGLVPIFGFVVKRVDPAEAA